MTVQNGKEVCTMREDSAGPQTMPEEEESPRLVLGTRADVSHIYELIQKQFPEEEIYQIRTFLQMMNNDRYKILLFRRESDFELIGYATTYSMPLCETVWLDLFAVLPQYQNKGYGQKLFNAVYQKYCASAYNGLLLCAEKVDESDPEKAEIQRRRLAFYKKVGAYILQTDFQIPQEDGGFPMYLLYKPRKNVHVLTRQNQMMIVGDMFDYCYKHVKHRQRLFNQIRHTMVEETFYSKEK